MADITDTLIDISHESALSKGEKISLRLIAKEVKKLIKERDSLCRRLELDQKIFKKALEKRA